VVDHVGARVALLTVWHRSSTSRIRNRTSLLRGSRLRVTYEGPEYPNFIAIGNDTLEFGLEHRERFRAEPSAEVLTWQLVVSDIDEAARACTEAGLVFEARTHEPGEGWRCRTLELVSPNGYRVALEGLSE